MTPRAPVLNSPDQVIESYLATVLQLPTSAMDASWSAGRVRPMHVRATVLALVARGFAWQAEWMLLRTTPAGAARARYRTWLRALRHAGWRLEARAAVVRGLRALQIRAQRPAAATWLYERTMERHIPRATIGWPAAAPLPDVAT